MTKNFRQEELVHIPRNLADSGIFERVFHMLKFKKSMKGDVWCGLTASYENRG